MDAAHDGRRHERAAISFEVNGTPVSRRRAAAARLSSVLRDELRLTGTKVGCDAGDCGACTVLLDGEPVCACLCRRPARRRGGATVEGLANGRLSALQASFLRHGAAQCGICTPGMLVAATALLETNPRPDRRRGEGCARRRALPLHRLPQDHRGGDGCLSVRSSEALDLPASPQVRLSAVGASPRPRLDGVPESRPAARTFGADSLPGRCAGRAGGPLAALSRALSPSATSTPSWRSASGHRRASSPPPTFRARTASASSPPFADQPALAEGVARFRGEAVALVVGEREAIAISTSRDFPIDWTELPHLLQPCEAQADGAADPCKPRRQYADQRLCRARRSRGGTRRRRSHRVGRDRDLAMSSTPISSPRPASP